MQAGFEIDPDLRASQLLAQQLEAEESELAAREAQEHEDERDRRRDAVGGDAAVERDEAPAGATELGATKTISDDFCGVEMPSR